MARKKNSLINRLNDFKKLPKIKMPKLKLDNIDRIEELRVDFDCLRCRFTLSAGGKTKEFAMNTACNRIERVSVSTKPLSALPYNTVYDNGKYGTKEKVLPGAGEKTELTQTDILSFRFVSED